MKKGILLKNTLGIIIAVLGLAVLVLGVYKAISVGINQETKDAQNTLDNLMAKIYSSEESVNTKVIVQGFSGADNWAFVGWNKEEETENNPLPQKCFLFDSCICICKGSATASGCDKKGFCQEVKGKDVKVLQTYSKVGDAQLNVKQEFKGKLLPNDLLDVKIKIDTEVNCIPLAQNLFDVSVSRNIELISVTADYGFLDSVSNSSLSVDEKDRILAIEKKLGVCGVRKKGSELYYVPSAFEDSLDLEGKEYVVQ